MGENAARELQIAQPPAESLAANGQEAAGAAPMMDGLAAKRFAAPAAAAPGIAADSSRLQMRAAAD